MSILWTRRRLVQTVVTGGLGVSLARLAAAHEAKGAVAAELPERAIELFNTHTGESASVVYRRGNEFDVAALATLKNVLRDHRNGEAHDMDPRLYDQLHSLSLAAHCEPRFEIISGYRSPESNDQMSSRPGSGVAEVAAHAGPGARRASQALSVRTARSGAGREAGRRGVLPALGLRAYRHRGVPYLGWVVHPHLPAVGEFRG